MKEVIEKLKEYYKEDKLEILDNGKSYEFDKHYSAVSISYLHKHVLKEKYNIKVVAKAIIKLCEDEMLRPIPCDYANNLVFIRYNFYRDTFVMHHLENGKIKMGHLYGYKDKHQEYINDFNELLKD